MELRGVERRQHRRIALDVPVEIRSLEPQGAAAKRFAGRARDVSLAGVFALMPEAFPLAPGTPVACSVTIPPEAARVFPFSRLAAKGWIVRVTLEAHAGYAAERGVAVAFTGDATALGTIPG